MSVSVFLPQSGMGISEATIVKWLKGAGDAIKKGEIILEIETAKSVVEVEAPATGILTDLLFGEDETVEVGTQIATIEES